MTLHLLSLLDMRGTFWETIIYHESESKKPNDSLYYPSTT